MMYYVAVEPTPDYIGQQIAAKGQEGIAFATGFLLLGASLTAVVAVVAFVFTTYLKD